MVINLQRRSSQLLPHPSANKHKSGKVPLPYLSPPERGATMSKTQHQTLSLPTLSPQPHSQPHHPGLSCREIASKLAQEAHNHSQSLVRRVQLLAAIAESYAAQKEGLLHEVQRLEVRKRDEIAGFTRQIDDLNKKVVQYESQIQKLQEGAVGPRTIHELKAAVAKRDEELRLQNARAEALLQEVTERDTRISDLSHEVEALTKLVQERDRRIEELKSLTGSMGLGQMVEIASRLQKWGLVSD